jgi:hypothetical protein
MMDGLCINPVVGFVVRIFIYGCYFKKAYIA